MSTHHREIPFNYTSADDRQAVQHLLGDGLWEKLEALRARRVTGRSARLLMRVFGELLVHRRNPYLYQELVAAGPRRRRFFKNLETDLAIVEERAGGDAVVLDVVSTTRALLETFKRELGAVPGERARLMGALAPIVGKDNVLFDPFTLVSHATDATDWRLHLPFAVVMPTSEDQVPQLLATLERLDRTAIPRGAGTGLTGGTVPLRPGTVIINTEKLNRIRSIEERELRLADGRTVRAPVMTLEAGVVTEVAMEHAAEHGLVFATDPTSAWASTIGGNISENAGGKTAVLWGTCIDNLLSYSMAMPGGVLRTVRRTDHQLRKILPDDPVTFEVRDERDEVVETIALSGKEIRRKGLWKDITNKVLKGLPGLQKEGTDGVITSAELVLYKQYASSRTLCLEFFGPDMDEASCVILELARAFPNEGHEVLQALEHFDDEYVRAIGYKVKAARAEAPKAVLLIDVVGHTSEETARGIAKIREILAHHANTCVFEAKDKAEAKRFWADRKKLGAIAARTNAFKLNEDIVLPLEALAEFARFCDTTNVEEERASQTAFAERVRAYLEAAREEDGGFLPEKIAKVMARCDEAIAALPGTNEKDIRSLAVAEALRKDLLDRVRGYEQLAKGIDAIFAEERRRRIVIATHMHAGDGNVHVNIPVLSNDRAMMRRAEHTVDRVMDEVKRLGGVCSGEHGIGITKLKYLDPGILAELQAYRGRVDPRGTMNPGKLQDLTVLDQVFTPSFNLLELEARILQHGKLEDLAVQIAQCVRCGKCKPDCCVYHPGRGMFFHPRNKNLAIGALIEALLYEAQRERSSSFELLRHLEEVADHCTICHKCLKPCPVDIDTGKVSVLEREILMAHGYKHHALPTRAALCYLESTSPAFNAVFRTGMRVGMSAQRLVANVLGPAGEANAPASSYVMRLLRSPMTPTEPQTLRDVLPATGPGDALVLEPKGEPKATVFYFPGCGSERLFASISMAALHVLLETGTRVVLPPPFLCCGCPAYTNARTEQYGRIALRNTIIFSQIREMFSYLEFDAVVVTCGTCRAMLGAMETEKIFGAPLKDLARFELERGISVKVAGAADGYLYHAPCHDTLDGQGPEILAKLAGIQAEPVPHCCSDAGTLSYSRPDITDSMLHRKAGVLKEALANRSGKPVVLTNCPGCLQGLGRNARLGIEPRHVAVELARALSGDGWKETLRERAAKAQVIHF